MKNKITEYVPNAIELDRDLDQAEFESIEELLNIPFVATFAKVITPAFHRFSVSSNSCLMAEYNKGAEWWVVGIIEFPEKVNLPRWKKP